MLKSPAMAPPVLIVFLLLAASLEMHAIEPAPDQRQIRDLKITILSSQVAESLVGVGEWGFAALVEADERKLLFDTGAYPETVLRNAAELGIDLSQESTMKLRRLLGASADQVYVSGVGSVFRSANGGRRPAEARF